jgi:hypothetical protein
MASTSSNWFSDLITYILYDKKQVRWCILYQKRLIPFGNLL